MKSLGWSGRILIPLALVLVSLPPFMPVRASGNFHLCMIDYNYHNDNHTNADMTAIKATIPDILIDNTAHGLWGIDGGNLGNDNTDPSRYTPLGIDVYSYITAGNEGTTYNTPIDELSANLARVDGIAVDGAELPPK